MRFRDEHLRAIDAPGSALGAEFVETGRVEEIDAYDAEDAAALALAEEDETIDAASLDFAPGDGLYALPGEDEAVRVTPVTDEPRPMIPED
jgi:hypothetical protein